MSGALGIILVNYNSWRETVECLASLRALTYPDVRVFVVDNASLDQSRVEIRNAAPEVQLVELSKNTGFAGGCNAGIRAAVGAGCSYLWLLNNDTEVSPESGSLLVETANANPEYEFFGSLVSFFNRPDLTWFGGGKFNAWTGAAEHVGYLEPVEALSRPGCVETDWITGCSLFFRAKSLAHIGWLDEDYFLYGEDVEWQIRAGMGRPRALLLCKSLVRHKVGRSTGTTDAPLGRAFMSRNFIRTARYHSGLRFPLWIGWWALWYCVVPAMRGRWPLFHAGWYGAISQSTPGNDLVRHFRIKGGG